MKYNINKSKQKLIPKSQKGLSAEPQYKDYGYTDEMRQKALKEQQNRNNDYLNNPFNLEQLKNKTQELLQMFKPMVIAGAGATAAITAPASLGPVASAASVAARGAIQGSGAGMLPGMSTGNATTDALGGVGGEMLGPVAVKAAPLIKKGLQSIPVYKVNPWAFKPKSNMLYRAVDDIDPILSSGTIPSGNYTNLYNSVSNSDYIISLPNNATNFRPIRNTRSSLSARDINIQKGELLRKNNFFGYKPVPIDKSVIKPRRVYNRSLYQGSNDLMANISADDINAYITNHADDITENISDNFIETIPYNSFNLVKTWSNDKSSLNSIYIKPHNYKNEHLEMRLKNSDSDVPYYNFGFYLPSSPIVAGRGIKALKESIPSGAKILEDVSMSSDSYPIYLTLGKESSTPAQYIKHIPLNSDGKKKFVINSSYKKGDLSGTINNINNLLKKSGFKEKAYIEKENDLFNVKIPTYMFTKKIGGKLIKRKK